jgi:hypothetical protein
MMSKGATVLRNSLILLTLGVSVPAAWAAELPRVSTPVDVATQTGTAPPRPRVLDLKSPDIRDVMSAEQITAAIPNPDDVEIIGPETVQVRGATPPPYVPSGFASLYWAATHPTGAWRIFTPVQ